MKIQVVDHDDKNDCASCDCMGNSDGDRLFGFE